MPLNKEQKKQVLDNVSGIVENNSTVVFVNFHGLSVAAANELRGALKSQDVGYYVAKKILTKMALSNSNVEGEIPFLEGELALAYGKDAIAPAREIKNLQKKYGNYLFILGGIFNGEFVSKDRMEEIASIPSAQALYGQLVWIINSPFQKLVSSLDQVAKTKES